MGSESKLELISYGFFPFNFLHKSESKAGRIAGESTRSGKKRVRAQRKPGWGGVSIK